MSYLFSMKQCIGDKIKHNQIINSRLFSVITEENLCFYRFKCKLSFHYLDVYLIGFLFIYLDYYSTFLQSSNGFDTWNKFAR